MASLFRKSKYSTLGVITPPAADPAVAPHHSSLAAEPLKKKDIPEGLWEKCKKCGEMNFTKAR